MAEVEGIEALDLTAKKHKSPEDCWLTTDTSSRNTVPRNDGCVEPRGSKSQR